MQTWCPWAIHDLVFPDAGPFVGGPFRGVLHTVESSTYASARAAYAASHNGPHVTVDGTSVHQHVALDRAATALVHTAGAIDTNRLSCIQIEVVGFAAQPAWPAPLIAQVRMIMSWIEQQTGIRSTAPVFKPYPASYGANNGVRFTPDQWRAFNGWCGHMHVPENDHGDPGAIPIAQLLLPQGVKPMYSPPLGPIAAVWQQPNGDVIAGISPGGFIYAWGCKWYGNVAGKPYWGSREAARIGARDDGQPGYMITATDGATYRLPDGLDHL